MYIRYIHKLCDMHLQAENYTGESEKGKNCVFPLGQTWGLYRERLQNDICQISAVSGPSLLS